MGVHVDTTIEKFPSEIPSFISRPSTLFLGMFIALLTGYTYYDLKRDPLLQNEINSFLLFALFILSPMITAVLFDNYWSSQMAKGNSSVLHMYHVVRKSRTPFFFAGFVFSFMVLFISIPLKLLVTTNAAGEFSISVLGDVFKTKGNFLHIMAFVLASTISGIITAASFYRVRGQDIGTGKRYNFISNPVQIATLTSYTFIGINFSLWLLWMGSRLQFPNNYTVLPLEQISLGTVPLFFAMSFAYFFGIIFGAIELPHFIDGSRYKFPNSSKLKRMAFNLGLMVIIVAFLAYSMVSFSDVIWSAGLQNLLNYAFLILMPIILFQFGKKPMKNFQLCPVCNVQMDKSNQCQICTGAEIDGFEFKIKLSKKVYHPTCPSCGEIWDNLSRRCNNCGFTIILSCNKCGQTLNPLWTKCNQCGTYRKPIPQVALESPGSPSHVRSQAFLLILMAYLVPTTVLQVTFVISTIELAIRDEEITREIMLLYIYDDVARLLMLLIVISAIIVLLVLSFDDKIKGMVLIANRMAIAPGSIIVLSSVMIFTVFAFKLTLTAIFTSLTFGPALYFLLSSLFLMGVLYGYYSALIQFRPVMPYDPELDRLSLEVH